MAYFVPTPGGAWEALISDRDAIPVVQLHIDTTDSGSTDTDITQYIDSQSLRGGGKMTGAFGEAIANQWSVTLKNTTLGWDPGDYANALVEVKAGFMVAGSPSVITIFTGYVSEKGAQRSLQSVTKDTVKLEMYDAMRKWSKVKMDGVVYANYKICDPSDTAASLFHQYTAALGIDNADITAGTVDETKSLAYAPHRGFPLKELQKIAQGYLGVLKVQYDGELFFESRFQNGYSEPSSEWDLGGVGSYGNVHRIEKDEAEKFCTRCKLEFQQWEQLPNNVGSYREVYKNTTGHDPDTDEISIAVAAGDYYPGPGQYDVLQCNYKDPHSSEGLIATGVQTPTIGTTGSEDIVCSASGISLISFNGSTSATQATEKASQMILRNTSGGTVTITRMRLRGTGYRVSRKVICEDIDSGVSNDWEHIEKKVPGEYIDAVDIGNETCEYWQTYGGTERRTLNAKCDFIPQVQEGALVNLTLPGDSPVTFQILEYEHRNSGPTSKTYYTEMKLRQWMTFTASGTGSSIAEDVSDPSGASSATSEASLEDVPTYEELDDGYTYAGGDATVIPTVPTVTADGTFKGVVLRWDRQRSLTNFDRYEVQVSDDNSTWYDLQFDGYGWGESVGQDTDWYSELLVHMPIPFGGTDDNPTVVTLYYRVRRCVKSGTGSNSDWSTPVTATTALTQNGDIAYQSITANKVTTSFLQAVHAAIDTLFVGYDGSGSYASPSEGDYALRIVDAIISRIQYLNGGWSNVNMQAMGKLVGALLVPLFVGCGLWHPEAPDPPAQPIPTPNFHHLTFETNYDDQYGNSPDDTTNMQRSSSWAQFGTYSLTATSGNYDSIEFDDYIGLDENIGFCSWINTTGTGVCTIARLLYQVDGSNYLDIYLSYDYTNEVFEATLQEWSGGVQQQSLSAEIAIVPGSFWGATHCVGLVVDFDAGEFSVVLNDAIDTETLAAMTLSGTAATNMIAVYGYNANAGRTVYQDDVLFAYDDACDPDLFVSHYLAGVGWDTTYTYNDMVVGLPDTGRLVLVGGKNFHDTGWTSETDFTNQTLTVQHNLNQNLAQLWIVFSISSDGTDANEIRIALANCFDGTSHYGVNAFPIDRNSYEIHTADAGIIYLNKSTGYGAALTSGTYYWRARTYCLPVVT